MKQRKLLFIDRDGTLIVEPPDQQIDCFEKFALVDGAIPALRRCIEAGYELVMVSNQDGLGTESFPRASFEGPHNLLLQILASQGIVFREILIDESHAHQARSTRKPGVGMVRHHLCDDAWNRAASAVIGDRETDLQFASNIGVRGFRIGEGWTWEAIAHALCDAPRSAQVRRTTKETDVEVRVDLDAQAAPKVASGVGFFDHMLEQLGKHGGFALELACKGDTHIDEHHVVEDCALALGETLRAALGDKRGIERYGSDPAPAAATLPMDETLAHAAIDLSARPYFVFEGKFPRERVGDLSTELVPHFFRSLSDSLGATLHLSVRGENAHHMVEACFKATARALRQAFRRDGRDLPSTKGTL